MFNLVLFTSLLLSLVSGSWIDNLHSFNFTGEIVISNSSNYMTSLQLYNSEYDAARPSAIAYCTSAEDVIAAIKAAHAFSSSVIVRSGN